MKVKCQICGKEIEKENAFSISKDGKTFYYCSSTEYYQKRKYIEQRAAIIDTYIYCLDCDPSKIYSLLQKEFNSNLKQFGIESIYIFVTQNKEKIKRTIVSKAKENEDKFTTINKIKYITAIIKNQILNKKVENNQSKEPMKITEAIDINMYNQENKYVSKRRSLNELEDLYEDDDNR